MPYKNKDKQRRVVRQAVRKIRKRQATLKQELQADVDAMRKLASMPKAYELIFGKPQRKAKKKKRTR